MAFRHTLTLVVLAVGLQYILGMAMALLLNEDLKGLGWVKYTIMIPWVIPVASTVVMFDWLVLPDYGLINMILRNIGLGHLTRYWFGDKNFAFPLVVIMHVWRNMPFYAITLYAGLKSIPKYFYEAADIDGASPWQKFFYITLPNLKYPSMIVIVLHVLWTFNNFDFIYLSTGGGPVGSTEVLATQIYQTAWNYYEYGHASAMGILMMLVMMVFSIFYIRLIRSDD
jgi:ABC-type sugar transport system permease subunit